jgi:hypothetical protein
MRSDGAEGCPKIGSVPAVESPRIQGILIPAPCLDRAGIYFACIGSSVYRLHRSQTEARIRRTPETEPLPGEVLQGIQTLP